MLAPNGVVGNCSHVVAQGLLIILILVAVGALGGWTLRVLSPGGPKAKATDIRS
jgi:hypothetical protein